MHALSGQSAPLMMISPLTLGFSQISSLPSAPRCLPLTTYDCWLVRLQWGLEMGLLGLLLSAVALSNSLSLLLMAFVTVGSGAPETRAR